VFVKATQGATEVDRGYVSNIRGARAAHLAVGSYHYFVPDNDVVSQFRHFIANALVEPGDLPPVIDIEGMNHQDNAALATELNIFLSLLEAHYGARPIIYTGRDFANVHLKGFSIFPLWLAEYSAAQKPVLPLDWGSWTFWQKSQRGTIEGIDGCVDLDSFNGDNVRFQDILLKGREAMTTVPTH
jgi:lysozyme